MEKHQNEILSNQTTEQKLEEIKKNLNLFENIVNNLVKKIIIRSRILNILFPLSKI